VRPLKKHLGEKKMALFGTISESVLLFFIPLMPSVYSLCGILGNSHGTITIYTPKVASPSHNPSFPQQFPHFCP
jgi:hypothetical protein